MTTFKSIAIAAALIGGAFIATAPQASAAPAGAAIANAAAPLSHVSDAKIIDVRHHRGRRVCAAVAKRRFGRGGAIRSTYRVARGFRACRRARLRCHRALSNRQAFGRNPVARCVILGRV